MNNVGTSLPRRTNSQILIPASFFTFKCLIISPLKVFGPKHHSSPPFLLTLIIFNIDEDLNDLHYIILQHGAVMILPNSKIPAEFIILSSSPLLLPTLRATCFKDNQGFTCVRSFSESI